MTDSNGVAPRKSRARTIRFALYAVILLGVLAWTRHEQAKIEEAETEAMEALQKQQREAQEQRRLITAAFNLVDKVDEAKDADEQIRMYDEIITTYRGFDTVPLRRCVSWALYKKALAVTDLGEKYRLYEEVVDEFCEERDKAIRGYVRASLRERLHLIEGGAEKVAFCDAMLEKYGDRLPDGTAASLLYEKAEATRDANEEIAIYDAILARFLTSSDDSAFDLAVITALDKMKLVDDPDEQIRLCDIAIDAFLNTPQRTRYYLFDRAITKKAQLVGDPSLPLALWNQVIANNVTESSVVQARSQRMPLLKDDSERLAACEETIAAHQDSKSDFVQLMVARAMARKGDLTDDPEAKQAIFRSVLDKCETVEDSRARDLANQTVAKLTRLSGDTTAAIQFYDQASASDNLVDALRALSSKAELIKDPAEKIRLYDEILERAATSDDQLVARQVVSTLNKKARLSEDRQEKLGLYDEIITRSQNSRDSQLRSRVVDTMFTRAELLDRDERIKVYDEIIAKQTAGGGKKDLENAARAMLKKAEIVADRNERIRLYDTVLFDLNKVSVVLYLEGALRDRAALEAGVDERVRLYDRFLATYAGSIEPHRRISLLLEKTEFIADPDHRSRSLDEIIRQCEEYLTTDQTGGIFSEFNNVMVFDTMGEAIIAKAEHAANDEERRRLYDRYLNSPHLANSRMSGYTTQAIIAKRAGLAEDSAEKSKYFDDHIQSAATDEERVRWYVQKAQAAKGVEKISIKEEMLARFFDNTEVGIEKTISNIFVDKITRTERAEERIDLCDRLIERYQNSTDGRTLAAVVRALGIKAQAVKNENRKIEIYGTAIDRYKGNDDFFVKKAVDSLIVARFRLEAKRSK